MSRHVSSAGPESNSAFCCPICEKEYGRIDHLQRHLNTHTSHRPFTCVQCGRSYRRRDVLTRHHQNCKPGAGIPRTFREPVKRQSTRRACDRCVKQKKVCSNSTPCQNCTAQRKPCTYPPHIVDRQRQSSDAASEAALEMFEVREEIQHPQPSSNLSMGEADGLSECELVLATNCVSGWLQHGLSQGSLSPEANNSHLESLPPDPAWPGPWLHNTLDLESSFITNRDPASHFQFLVGFPRNRGLAETFELGKCTQSFLQTSFKYDASEAILTDMSQNTQDPSLLASCDDPLLMKTMEICNGIRKTILNHPSNIVLSVEWSPLTEAMIQQLFGPSNLRRFLQLYWTLWHPHWPCIHKPTFQYHTTPSMLLAALVLIGASLSPRSQDRENACIWFDIVEEWVFSDNYVTIVTMGCDDHNTSTQDNIAKVKLLQATFAVCIYQLWQGGESAKNRVRRCRFNVLVGVSSEDP